MAKVTISVELDTNDAKDFVVGEKLAGLMDALEFSEGGSGDAAKEDKPAPKTRTRKTAAPKEEEEDKPAPKTRTRGGAKTAPKKGDELEELAEEASTIMEKVVDEFRKDIKDELAYYGVKSISDFKAKADLQEFIVFLKELEEDLAEEEEEEEPAPPARRSRARK